MAKTYAFTGTDGSSLDADFTILQGALQILNNKAANNRVIDSTGDFAFASVATVEGAADDTVTVTITGMTDKTSGIQFRVQDEDNNWQVGINGAGLLRILSTASGSSAVRASYTIPSFDASNDYTIETTFVGQAITVKLDGVDVLSYTHGTTFLITETSHGFKLGDTAVTADDFTVDSLTDGDTGGGTDPVEPTVKTITFAVPDDLQGVSGVNWLISPNPLSDSILSGTDLDTSGTTVTIDIDTLSVSAGDPLLLIATDKGTADDDTDVIGWDSSLVVEA